MKGDPVSYENAWREAYCFECRNIQTIVAVLGIRNMVGVKSPTVAVELACGHSRQGRNDRVVMSVANLSRLTSVVPAKLTERKARALSMTG